MIPPFATPYLRLQQLLVEARHARGLTQSEIARQLQVPQSFVSKYERGERRLDVIELLQILDILDLNVCDFIGRIIADTDSSEPLSILEQWKLTPWELTRLVDENPSLRGMMLGYAAEHKLKEIWLSGNEIKYLGKPDDHDRTSKGDHIIEYMGERFIIESKSLQSRMVEKDGDTWRGRAQVDASDRRPIVLADGSRFETTLLAVGEFDVLSVNCFAFDQEWRFVFARNTDLPRSTYRRYPADVREQLIASLVSVSWPPEPPFTEDLREILDGIIEERRTSDSF